MIRMKWQFILCLGLILFCVNNLGAGISVTRAAESALVERIEESRRILERTRERQREIVDQIDGTRAEERELLNALYATEREVSQNTEELERFEKRLFETQRDLILVQQDIDELRDSLAGYHETLNKRLISIYKRRQSGYTSFFLQSESLLDFMKRFKLIRMIVRQDADAFADVRERYVQIMEKEEKLREQQRNLRSYQSRLEEKKKDLTRLEEQHLFLIEEIRQRREKLEEEYREIEKSSVRITAIIEELENQKNEEDAPAPRPVNPEDIRRAEQKRAEGRRSLRMIWPVGDSDKVIKTFGHQRSAMNTTFDSKGIGIAADQGDPVKASAAGRIMYRGELRGYGRIVIVDHGYGVNSLYAHLEDVLVRVNQEVQSGQEIATIGPALGDEGTNLHFEVRVEGEPNNPMNWLRR